MTYTKTTWLDELRDAQGNITRQGTPLSAANMDHIEQGIADAHAQIDTTNTQSIAIQRGLSAITTDQATPLWVKKIIGRTLVNLLGRDGNCEDTAKFTYTGGTAVLDNTRKTSGSNSIKVTKTAADTFVFERSFYPNVGDCFIAIADIYLENPSTNIYFSYSNIGVSSSAKGVTGSAGITSKYAGVTGQFIPVIEAFEIISVTTPGTSYFRPRLKHSGTSGHLFNVDSYRLYKITKAKYDSFTSQVTLEQAQAIAAEYPYVDDMKSLTNPYVVASGKNLLPPFKEWTNDSHNTIVEPYKMQLNPTALYQQSFGPKIPVISGQTYTFSTDSTSGANFYWSIHTIDVNGTDVEYFNTAGVASGSYNYTFTIPANIKYLTVNTANQATSGTFTFTNPQLELGSTATAFEPKNDDLLAYNVSLASSVDGTVYDSLSYVNGKPMKEARFKEIVLDGSLGWSVSADFTGYKQVGFTLPSPSVLNANAVKYDGKVLPYNNSLNNSDQIAINSSDTVTFYVTVSDTDSGWGETWTGGTYSKSTYTSLTRDATDSDMIKALMNGWKWESSGTGGWSQVDVSKGSATSSDVDYVINNYAPGWTGWATLIYQLATPTLEEVQPIGAINIENGSTQIEVGEGFVSREIANPQLYSTEYQINGGGIPASKLKYAIEKPIAVYKNGLKDLSWVFDNTPYPNFGKWFLKCSSDNFDPTAVYEVSYIAEPYTFTAPTQSVELSYNTNLKTVVDSNTQNITDLGERMSVVEKGKANKEQMPWISPTLLNGTLEYSSSFPVGYMKDEFGFVHLRGMIKSFTAPTTVFYLPKGYRMFTDAEFGVASNNGSLVLGNVEIRANGTVFVASGGNTWLSLSDIPPFRAEQ